MNTYPNTTQTSTHHPRLPLPEWFKIRPPQGEKYKTIQKIVGKTGLATVCEEAHCPNLSECWSGGTATFMLLGDTCTRGCRFCAVKTGNPKGEIDIFEPTKLAHSIKRLDIDYVVITMVARDDLEDGGAAHIARCIRTVKKICPSTLIEVLISDLRENEESLKKVLDAGPVVLAQNIETVRRLTPYVRDGRAHYTRTLAVLKNSKRLAPRIYTKSSIMLGLGETEEEIITTMKDLRANDVNMLTLGQYLPPSSSHIALKEYVTPQQFARYETLARDLKFLYVASGPLVRSSYRAGELFVKNALRHERT